LKQQSPLVLQLHWTASKPVEMQLMENQWQNHLVRENQQSC